MYGNNVRTTETDTNFVANYTEKTRLGFIGTWKHRYYAIKQRLLPNASKLQPSELENHSRIVVHIDIDCFFLQGSVRTLRPDLIEDTETPMVVSWGETGEISCANYAARALGLHAGMRFNESDRKKPENVLVLSYCFDAYVEFATSFYEALFELTDHVIGSSCDEAYLDVTNGLKLDAVKEVGIESENASIRGKAMAKFIQKHVTEKCKLKCSVGSGPNKLVAKCATSKYAKPNGMSDNPFYYVSEENARDFMAKLPVQDLPGVGHVLFRKLSEEKIRTCADLQAIEVGSQRFMQLVDAVGGDVATYNLIQKAKGIDETEWMPDPPPQTTSMKISWGVRFETKERVLAVLKDMSKVVCDRAKMLGDRRAKSITFEIMLSKDVKSTKKKGFLGHGPCHEYSRSQNLTNATNDSKVINEKVRAILNKLNEEIHLGIESIRGLCVRLHFENTTGSPEKNPKKRVVGLRTDYRGPAQGLIGPQSKVHVPDKTQPRVNSLFMQVQKKQKVANETYSNKEEPDRLDHRNNNNDINKIKEDNGGEKVKKTAVPFFIEKEFKSIEQLFASYSRRLAIEMHRVRQNDEFKEITRGQEQIVAGLATACAYSLADHVRSAVGTIQKHYVYKEDIEAFIERVKNLTKWHERMISRDDGVHCFVSAWKTACDEVY